MKLVLFEAGALQPQPGLLTDRGVVSLASVAPPGRTPQLAMQTLIDSFEELRPRIDRLAAGSQALPLESVRLLAPLPRPGKILCSTSVCRRERRSEREPLLMTLKSPECAIGPGCAIELPDTLEPWQFSPEVELAAVIKGPAKRVGAEDWGRAVFGFTCAINATARGGSKEFGRDMWVSKADTLCAIGPCIVTADEIREPERLRIRSHLNGQQHQDFSYATADFTIGEQMAFITTVMTLHTGDLVLFGSSEQDAGEMRPGDSAEAQIEGIGRLTVVVGGPRT
ncbi:MAG TPA: fumarylacetoacetate hydrolase family protein [Chloroflexota bacterium]|jgi:2-keto-4-pentenoate hydratase/2-oxohepta-3-ene-1,7-dioic acid hydratase in catechol pathway|nr:fumarylacetoacetate hydrolase family protein [Chloroflexota bacterium]